jgi:hypothetical protein
MAVSVFLGAAWPLFPPLAGPLTPSPSAGLMPAAAARPLLGRRSPSGRKSGLFCPEQEIYHDEFTNRLCYVLHLSICAVISFNNNEEVQMNRPWLIENSRHDNGAMHCM